MSESITHHNSCARCKCWSRRCTQSHSQIYFDDRDDKIIIPTSERRLSTFSATLFIRFSAREGGKKFDRVVSLQFFILSFNFSWLLRHTCGASWLIFVFHLLCIRISRDNSWLRMHSDYRPRIDTIVLSTSLKWNAPRRGARHRLIAWCI